MMFDAKRWLYGNVSRVPLVHSVVTGQRFRLERRLLNGTDTNSSAHPSILHFSVNKAATQYVKTILSRCAKRCGMAHARLNEYARHTDLPYLDRLSEEEMSRFGHLFKPTGYLYSVFGGMIEGIPDLSDYRVVLMVRDPRDVVTSAYFSLLFSHMPPGSRAKVGAFYRNVDFARHRGIDGFVLELAEPLSRIYGRYEELLLRCHPDVHVTKYEQMISNFPEWLNQLLEYCELEISSDLKGTLIEEAERQRPKTENVAKHARQATPGDHRRKLRPETVELLDVRFAGALRTFAYEQENRAMAGVAAS